MSAIAVEAEQALLGGMILEPSRIAMIAARLRPEHFHVETHQRLFGLLLHMTSRRVPIDLVSLPIEVAREGQQDRYGGISYIVGLPDKIPSTANLGHYAEIVIEAWRMRGVEFACGDAKDQAARGGGGDDATALIDQTIADLVRLRLGGAGSDEPIGAEELFCDTLEDAEKSADAARRGETLGALPSGINTIDTDWRFLRRGDSIVLGARPSMGKSALLGNLVLHQASAGRPTGLVSAEMERRPSRDRLVIMWSGVEAGLYERPDLWTQETWDRVEQAKGQLSKMPLRYWHKRRATIDQIDMIARKWNMEFSRMGGLAFLGVDYLGLLGLPKGVPKHDGIAHNMESFDTLCDQIHTCGVMVHALNRGAADEGADRLPGMESLKDSGDLEYHSDVILLVHRPAYYNPSKPRHEARLVVAKDRKGPTGSILLEWMPEGQIFRSPTIVGDTRTPISPTRGIANESM